MLVTTVLYMGDANKQFRTVLKNVGLDFVDPGMQLRTPIP